MMRCESCQGKKRIVALGNIIKDCPSCKGIGWIEPEPVRVMEFPKPRKKPGKLKIVKPETILHV